MSAPVELGNVRVFFPKAEIMEVTTDDNQEFARFRVPITRGDLSSSVQIADNREEVIAAAKAALKASTDYFNARGKAKKQLESARVATLIECRKALNAETAYAIMLRKVDGGGKGERVSIALYPANGDPTAMLATIHTNGQFHRIPYSEEKAVRIMRRVRGVPVYHHMHLVVATKSNPVMVWNLNPEEPSISRISLEEGVEIRRFKEAGIDEVAETIADLGAKAEEAGSAPEEVGHVDTDEPKSQAEPIDLAKLTGLTKKQLTAVTKITDGDIAKMLKLIDSDVNQLAVDTGAPVNKLINAARNIKKLLAEHPQD